MSSPEHIPVLLQEVIDGLALKSNHSYMDGTIGAGGHSAVILEAIGPDGVVVGFDRDQGALQLAAKNLSQYGDRFVSVHDSYALLAEHAEELGDALPFSGILLDLGLSSMQIDNRERGFSFRFPDAALDMRYDQDQSRTRETSADLLNTLSADDLTRIFRQYGGVPRARRLAQTIVEKRTVVPFTTVGQLVEVSEEVLPRRRRSNPATTVFQALRIAVNKELEQLEQFLPVAVQHLAPGGRLAIITFHSTEDRMVKQFMREAARDCVCPPEFPECRCDKEASLRLISRKAIMPTEEEITRNPRARSAQLRIAERI